MQNIVQLKKKKKTINVIEFNFDDDDYDNSIGF